jgi:signal transduction histidine kinase
MKPKQSVFRVRRNYNQWVNNQTLEDYALRFTAKKARRFSLAQITSTALGSISFLALEAIGAAITLNYGFANAVYAIAVVSTIIFVLAIPICFHAANSGLDIDLLTRGAGFGYIGSTITSLVYASFTFIFFALETAIMAVALEWVFGLPLEIGYVLCALIVIPLVTHGITFISRFQRLTQSLWIALQIIPIAVILIGSPHVIMEWTDFKGSSNGAPQGLNPIHFGAACAVIFSLVAQIGEQVDYLRFMPDRSSSSRKKWWLTLYSAGPGWVVIGAAKMLIGSLLATIAFGNGLSLTEAADPTRMYAIAFGYAIAIPQLAIYVAAFFVVISQLKINVTNAYAGSIAWSNFFSRLTHSHPGRVVWLVFNVAIALVLMELGIYQVFEHILGGYALLAIAWLGALVGDLAINKPLGLSPKRIEFIRAYLYAVNPVGLGAMIIAGLIGLVCYTGLLGETSRAFAHFLTLAAALVLAPILAIITQSKYYSARDNRVIATSNDSTMVVNGVNAARQIEHKCSICENAFEPEDVAHCPAYEGYICSLCCSLDARCDDICKPSATPFQTHIERLKTVLPDSVSEFISIRLLYFLGLMLFATLISGSLLGVIYINASQQNSATEIINQATGTVLLQTFFVLQIGLGVVVWLFVLTNSSRRVAIEETHIQTQRLMDEIAAHDQTDKQLQQAKEHAEAANNAKSRYLTGLSHELRTPLNSILGYAQLLEQDTHLSINHQRQIAVIKRSGEHLADLIEGLLDISKIEAGRLDIHRNKVAIKELIDQLGYMFEPQALAKGLQFSLVYKTALPKYVITDEKRLRQILINLLSNAIKYTHSGSVEFTIRYRNQVAEFCIADTGIGIPESERERIFKPFERVRMPGAPQVTGTGLGLTITRLLIDIMGGELRLESNLGADNSTRENNKAQGTIFSASLMLSSIDHHSIALDAPKIIRGYKETTKNILILDDDPFHRGLVIESLNPLGFNVFEAPDIDFAKCNLTLDIIDLFILDVNLPDSSGWDFAIYLRTKGLNAPIIMVSADADEGKRPPQEPHNDYLIKPIRIADLLDKLELHLGLTWIYHNDGADLHDAADPEKNSSIPEIINQKAMPVKPSNSEPLPEIFRTHLLATLELLNTLYDYADSGNLSALHKHLITLQNSVARDEQVTPTTAIALALLNDLQPMIDRFELPKITAYLEQKINECQTQ